MRADLARRVAALESRQPLPMRPVDPDEARFDAMSDAELDAWFASYEPPADAAPGLSLADFEAMTDQELDEFFAEEWAYPQPQESRREPARRR